jgi:UDP-N-acetylglucosamine--N-acetylmuramyl-(pentapeptide) pyrophosphoryl-undecaprenol N-acetylglucosamine transferase
MGGTKERTETHKMRHAEKAERHVAIACGGTGGHLFPGMAVAAALQERGCEVLLIVSRKEIDRQGAATSSEFETLSLPLVPLLANNLGAFLKRSWLSFHLLRRAFKKRKPGAILAMGSFTSAPPVFAGKLYGALTCIHEANSVAGKANRFLAPWVDKVFIGFASAATQLRNRSVQFTGTPVRAQFQAADPESCRVALGLHPDKPVLLMTGGSQGASALNIALTQNLPKLLQRVPELQFLHLTGTANFESIRDAYGPSGAKAVVLPFLTEMELALGAATLAISRAGASSLAELAAMQVPAILVPYPAAADDHQYYNARAFAQAGAARLLVQNQLKPEILFSEIVELIENGARREQMKNSLQKWHFPQAADEIAESILRGMKPQRSAERAGGAMSLSLG